MKAGAGGVKIQEEEGDVLAGVWSRQEEEDSQEVVGRWVKVGGRGEGMIIQADVLERCVILRGVKERIGGNTGGCARKVCCQAWDEGRERRDANTEGRYAGRRRDVCVVVRCKETG